LILAVAETWTIREVLRWTGRDFAERGVDAPRLDAELLVAHALRMDRVGLYLDMERPLSADELARVRALVQRRRQREPVAYILGTREFFGRAFEVGPAVLVPRPDTETLVERALEVLPKGPARILDLCTGSGIIAISLAASRPDVDVDATDVSKEALEVAGRNAERHAVGDRIAWHLGDLFAAVPAGRLYDLVTANPPYISEGELPTLAPEVARWEPRLALAAGVEGLDVLERIAAGVPEVLRPGGAVLVEVGLGQASSVCQALEAAGLHAVRAHRDLGGVERVVEGRAPGAEVEPSAGADGA
jgi:release factor glutamine methyltransferase